MTNRSTVARRFQPRIKDRGPDPCPPLEGDRTGDFSGADPFLRGEEIDPDPGCAWATGISAEVSSRRACGSDGDWFDRVMDGFRAR